MAGGVEVKATVQVDDDTRLVFDPAHPDADDDGFVAYPNVDMILQQQTFIERPVADRKARVGQPPKRPGRLSVPPVAPGGATRRPGCSPRTDERAGQSRIPGR